MKKIATGTLVLAAVILIAGIRPACGCGHVSHEQATVITLKYLGTGLAAFHKDHGRFPTDVEGLAILEQKGGYLDSIPADSWGGPFFYRQAGAGDSYLLYSSGPNQRDERGQGDDIVILP